MIRVTIEKIKHGTGAPEVIGVMEITNDTTGTQTRGNYNARVLRRGTTQRTQRTGEVKDFPRLSHSVWRLVMRCLKSAFPEE